MSVPESPKRRQLRKALRALTNHVAGLKEHEFDVNQAKAQNIHILPMDLDQQSPSRPTFFASRSPDLLFSPDDSYDHRTPPGFCNLDSIPRKFREPRDGARNILEYFHHYVYACALFSKDWVLNEPWCPVSLGDVPFVNLNDHSSPEFVTSNACQVKDGPYPHLKAMVYNNLDGADDIILRGEVTIALRLIIAQMRRNRFIEHMTAPVLLFSFMGPQQVRLVEAYFNGSSVVVRPSRLFDLRTKNEAVLKELGQWFFGPPIGNTKECP
ncbi:hypothetical protein BDV37DRAFT_242029 [Aspergillus pseudonomiae]|uniref:Uncharacterized protein n=1 Tax=Aspergillus pseudonomiae TaxID=1506151 RepID=A0A5N7DK37_9EURO|nr:uncharacterized protein BDV37DRAFT_242029 [Aspergillus pseudonomiae]KAE8406801.1 hypothetical protein BDV37DRAFT_242029 [Aspergillus pseudonomiae]